MKSKLQDRALFLLYIAVIFAGMTKTYFFDSVETFSLPVYNRNVVIDPGHGGDDPGKVHIDGTNEKDINLSIAVKLQKYLEQGGSFVLTTRNDDSALSKKKREDLRERKALASSEGVDLMVSIHQNAFPKASVRGAQVFYFKKSEESKLLAECIQNRLKELDTANTRVAKANSEYYILKDSKVPAVIVECGFLSNPEEERRLKTDEYQDKLAWSIYLGINDYFQEIE